jgi:hypothetical protein
MPSRRSVLAGAAAGVAALSGCSSDDDSVPAVDEERRNDPFERAADDVTLTRIGTRESAFLTLRAFHYLTDDGAVVYTETEAFPDHGRDWETASFSVEHDWRDDWNQPFSGTAASVRPVSEAPDTPQRAGGCRLRREIDEGRASWAVRYPGGAGGNPADYFLTRVPEGAATPVVRATVTFDTGLLRSERHAGAVVPGDG